jgi:hypothetical protein
MNKFLSNVVELFTPYKLTETKNPLAIKEREYASAAVIQFTDFTSCIGVIAKEGSTLTAVHLVAASGEKRVHVFNTIDAVNVTGRLPKDPDAVTIVGYIDIWRNDEDNGKLAAAFQKLTSSFKKLEIQQREGTLRAEINGAGQIVVCNV